MTVFNEGQLLNHCLNTYSVPDKANGSARFMRTSQNINLAQQFHCEHYLQKYGRALLITALVCAAPLLYKAPLYALSRTERFYCVMSHLTEKLS